MISGLDDTFLVTNGDVLTTLELQSFIEYHHKQNAIATIATHTRKVNIDLGVIQSNDTNRVVGYIEKPTYEFQVSMGIYIFEPQVLNFIEPNRYLDFPDLVLRLLSANETVIGYPFDGYWQDLGRPDDYEHAIQEFDSIREQILGKENSTAQDWQSNNH